MPRQEVLYERNGPLLQSLGKHSVIGISKSAGDDLPRSVPWDFFFVDEDTHKLGNGKGRVSLRTSDRSLVSFSSSSKRGPHRRDAHIIELDRDVYK